MAKRSTFDSPMFGSCCKEVRALWQQWFYPDATKVFHVEYRRKEQG